MDSNNLGEIVIFNNEEGDVSVQVDAVNETIWMTQKAMAQLFGCSTDNIGVHLKKIFASGELDKMATTEFFSVVQMEGTREINRPVTFYNLDAIIAVGYRVNSKRATQFRIWATKTLRDYLVKGYLLDDYRFKKGQSLTYFKELLEKIREIRLSERVFYQQIKDIYALSIDYDKDDRRTLEFFAKIQNKLLWAVSGQTAAELIYYRANASLPMMGLTSMEKEGKVRTADIATGKNYLTKNELNSLKLIVEQYLAFAEAQAENHIPMYMEDWEKNLDIILTMNRKELLEGAGTISMSLAKQKARGEYNKFLEEERMQERAESIRELDADLRKLEAAAKQK